jgi:hypothetical protein
MKSDQLHAPSRLTPEERASGNHWVGGWVSPRAHLNAVEKRKSLAFPGNRTLTVQSVARLYTDWATPITLSCSFWLLIIFLSCIVGGGIKVYSTLRPLNGLLCQPRVIMIMEKSVEWLAGETEVLGENLPQCRFDHHKPHMLPVREPEPPRWEASV